MFFLRASLFPFAVFSALGATGCAGESSHQASGTGAGTAASSGDSTGSGGATGCSALKQAIADEVAGSGTCTATVRFRYATYEPLGFQILCGGYVATDIKQAYATAIADTNIELADSLTEKAPKDDFVFYRAPIDFGGAAAVSARSGLTVFGGTIVWDGTGDIDFPTAFRPAADLGLQCPSKNVSVSARGFDLANKASLDPALVDAALAAVNKTVLLEAMAKESYLFDAMVLLYPRRVGVFDPKSAEWVLLVNSGFLE